MDFVGYLYAILAASWHILQDAAVFIIIGLLVGGLLKVYLSTSYVAAHLGKGRFLPVIKAALLGVPLPLCSCGVLPAAASLKKQGANNGATTAFLISTPESGVDSIAVSWALLDPIMTVFRPVAAFLSAVVAGTAENLVRNPSLDDRKDPPACCGQDGCCSSDEQETAGQRPDYVSFSSRIAAGLRYAFTDLWEDLAGSFFVGILLAGIIAVLIPDSFITAHLGGGLLSMLIMLVIGVPMYICATASTPVAAAFILKGVSPGAALVFLLAGPATNIATLTVLSRLLGRNTVVLYLVSIAVVSIGCGLALDQLYAVTGISARAVVGEAAEITPSWLRTASAVLILGLSVKPIWATVRGWLPGTGQGCGCTGGSCSDGQPEDQGQGTAGSGQIRQEEQPGEHKRQFIS